MKKICIIPIALLLIILTVFCGCSNDKQCLIESISPQLDAAVSAAIIKDCKDGYHEGECAAEGHKIYCYREDDGQLTVFVTMSYAEYGFQDGDFVSISGTITPAVIELEADSLELIKINYPECGANYSRSIKEMFPSAYRNKALDLSDKELEEINNQQKKYAKDYLDSIGREAEIGDYSDFDHLILTDLGVSVEVSNKLIEYDKYTSYYPYWIGNQEFIENGTRYVYQMDYDEQNNQIIYSKFPYDNPDNITEKIIFDSLSGEIIK